MADYKDLTIGVVFVGLILTACLFGVTTSQTGWYFRHYPQDRRLLKFLVVAIWSIDATHFGLYFATIYTYLVKKNAFKFEDQPLPWMSNAQLLCNATAICMIQSFYASRIWTLAMSKHKLLLAVMVLFIASTWLFSFSLFLKTIFTATIVEFVHLAPYDIAMSVLTASTDVLLCGALVFLLSTSRTGTEGADRLINKLLLYTVNTGLLTSICAVMTVILVAILPGTSLFVMFYYIGSRLYSVSLLATLNARLGLRIQAERMGEHTLPEIEVTTHAVNKRSLQVLHRPDIVVSVQYDPQLSTTTQDNPISLVPLRLHCDGGRCYMVPDLEFLWTPDPRQIMVPPVPPSQDLSER